MGLAASQARFLHLTGRKTNVEYEGQQVNQARTALANQSANYYNQLLMINVPTPPSTTDFTKVVYTFGDKQLSNQITFMVAKPNGEYMVSYKSSHRNDFALLTGNSNIVVSIGEEDDTFKLYDEFINGTAGGCYNYLQEPAHDNAPEDQMEHIVHVVNHMLGPGNYTTSEGNNVSVKNNNGNTFDSIYWTKPSGQFGGDGEIMAQIADKLKDTKTAQKLANLLYDTKTAYNNGQTDKDTMLAFKKRLINIVNTDLKATLNRNFRIGNDELRVAGTILDAEYNADGSIKTYIGNDPYLKTLSTEELNGLIGEEQEFAQELDKKVGGNTWMVRYVQNTSSGRYEAQFYSKDELSEAYYNQYSGSESSLKYHYVGTEIETSEVKGVAARFEQDATGRYTSITIHSDDPILATTYALKTDITTDQVAYENAMNQYYYDKKEYEQTIQQINAKIKTVQEKDKSLELKLRQLDTEQAAITQEFEAVQKVLEKNTENSFNLFG